MKHVSPLYTAWLRSIVPPQITGHSVITHSRYMASNRINAEDLNPRLLHIDLIKDRSELDKILKESLLAKKFMQQQLDDYKVFIANAREYLMNCRGNSKKK